MPHEAGRTESDPRWTLLRRKSSACSPQWTKTNCILSFDDTAHTRCLIHCFVSVFQEVRQRSVTAVCMDCREVATMSRLLRSSVASRPVRRGSDTSVDHIPRHQRSLPSLCGRWSATRGATSGRRVFWARWTSWAQGPMQPERADACATQVAEARAQAN